ncbi:ergothioneine biosynthesis protein EgtB, partial [Burkholderia pseudomallei]
MTKNEESARGLASELARVFTDVRRHSVELARPLSAEDQALPSMPGASPTNGHLVHANMLFDTG